MPGRCVGTIMGQFVGRCKLDGRNRAMTLSLTLSMLATLTTVVTADLVESSPFAADSEFGALKFWLNTGVREKNPVPYLHNITLTVGAGRIIERTRVGVLTLLVAVEARGKNVCSDALLAAREDETELLGLSRTPGPGSSLLGAYDDRSSYR